MGENTLLISSGLSRWPPWNQSPLWEKGAKWEGEAIDQWWFWTWKRAVNQGVQVPYRRRTGQKEKKKGCRTFTRNMGLNCHCGLQFDIAVTGTKCNSAVDFLQSTIKGSPFTSHLDTICTYVCMSVFILGVLSLSLVSSSWGDGLASELGGASFLCQFSTSGIALQPLPSTLKEGTALLFSLLHLMHWEQSSRVP